MPGLLTVGPRLTTRSELRRGLTGGLGIRTALVLRLRGRLGVRTALELRLPGGLAEPALWRLSRRRAPLLLPLWSPWLWWLPTWMRCRWRELRLRRRVLAGCGHALWRLTAGVTHRSPPESS
ncbi:hypothetical protein [Nocardia sp. NPDC019395]|uniref:hypothetical protein n=1 Tax=Nocardia sp. NPDC019395 TaxID=3154686 RepID=UPI0033C63A85